MSTSGSMTRDSLLSAWMNRPNSSSVRPAVRFGPGRDSLHGSTMNSGAAGFAAFSWLVSPSPESAW